MHKVGSVARTLIKIVGVFALYQVAIRVLRKRVHFPAPAFVGYFLDSDLRKRVQPPAKVVARSGIGAGMRVLEVGCGSGAYTIAVARAVGPEGQVYAADIQPAMLKQLESKLSRPENQDIRNVTLYASSACDLPFDDETFDVVYLVTVLQEIPNPQCALGQVMRVLKPDGKLAVTELLIDPDYPLMSTTIQMGQDAGFHVDAAYGNLWTYTVRFKKRP